jgi:hypothetical protein
VENISKIYPINVFRQIRNEINFMQQKQELTRKQKVRKPRVHGY